MVGEMNTMAGKNYTLYQGDCLEVMPALAAQSVHCVVTSPPYYGLRDYGHDGQIGLEETPEQYVAKLVAVFREVWRVLRDDGVVWLNLGDSYCGYKGDRYGDTRGNLTAHTPEANGKRLDVGTPHTAGIKNKDLIGIPWRVAFALQADGWYLRQDIIWAKPNPMPESVTDRCTKAHEYVFLLTKSARYWYDNEAIKEPQAEATGPRMLRGVSSNHKNINGAPGQTPHSMNMPRKNVQNAGGGFSRKTHKGRGQTTSHGESSERSDTGWRNRRSVWTVATQPYSGAHFATFPPRLIEPMVLAGCPARCCPTCGMGWERVVGKTPPGRHRTEMYDRGSGKGGNMSKHARPSETNTIGFRPACNCGHAESVAGVVLDPFNGSGTTGEVSLLNGRRYIGIELSADYIELSRERVGAAEDHARNAAGDLTPTARERASGQMSLLDYSGESVPQDTGEA